MEITNREKEYSKWKSRTWYLSVFWCLAFVLGLFANKFWDAELPMDKIVTWAGLCSVVYVGGEKALKAFLHFNSNGKGKLNG